tara:strand:+ start:211 stop:432 length:222 start_codon:yes stop_codon:yes gene_type:complete
MKKMKVKLSEVKEPKVHAEVYCDGCNEFHNTQDVIFENIEEDYSGRDVMTFECPVDREFHKGLITTRDYYFDD